MIDNNSKSKNPLARMKRNVYIGQNRTSLSFEKYVWENIDRIAREENLTVDEICSKIDGLRPKDHNLSTLIRFLVHEVTDLRPDITADNKLDLAETAHPFPSPLYVALNKIQNISKKTGM